MIVVQNSIPIRDEYREKFEAAFRERAGFVDNFPGFIRNDVMRPIKGNSYLVVTYWRSMEDFQKWMDSDSFKKAHSGSSLPKEAFDGDNHLTIHEVFVSSTDREKKE